MSLSYKLPVYIEDQEEWDSYNFGVCTCGFILCGMEATDGVRYDTEQDCIDAGCE